MVHKVMHISQFVEHVMINGKLYAFYSYEDSRGDAVATAKKLKAKYGKQTQVVPIKYPSLKESLYAVYVRHPMKRYEGKI